MVNERPGQSGGPSRPAPAGWPRASGSSISASPAAPRGLRPGLGLGKGSGGLGKGKGLGKANLKRHTKIRKDNIYGVTKGDIRRLARRGGVKRISATIYDDVRLALRERLARILKDCCAIVDSSGRKTVSVTDIVFTLRRLGNPIYGFEPHFLNNR
ncbi:hypothetical protein J4E93_005096 [Alternaria ventricosa]|uniref:uncharacterized protein n=1 Tax=Alternaria ventricosa TaxID=1187951 RepID=UPI0020C496A4|nr:uncharacterized protein J4E93_005096 [Alternaria ventricosa]KAI4646872.1 hypothetical protein J4E93_005096 [Alternaria ventricosa]